MKTVHLNLSDAQHRTLLQTATERKLRGEPGASITALILHGLGKVMPGYEKELARRKGAEK